jgi:acyl-CoA thioesterase YciA
LSQKLAGAAFHGLTGRPLQVDRADAVSLRRAVAMKSPPAARADRADRAITNFKGAPMTDILQLPQKHCALRVVPQPSDANVHGDVFGGWIMAQVDIAGSIPASRRANGRVATIAVNSFVFKQPVFVGDLLSFYADIVKTGNTSVTVEVEVYAQRMSLTEDLVKVTEATLTYVATDSDRRPRALPVLD